jgi:hypothetical protein
MDMGQIVGLIILGLFVLFALIGLFIGLARGARKSIIRIVFFVISTISAFAFTPMFSKMIMNLTITIGGTTINIAQKIDEIIGAEPIAVDLIQNSTALNSLYERAPYIIMNLVTFFLLFIVINFIGYILYHIFKGLFLKKKPKAWREDGTYQVDLTKTKKHRLVGGFVGALQSVIFFTLLLLPVTGFASTVAELTYQKDKTTQAYTPSATLIQENAPTEFLEIAEAYKTSPLYYSSKVLGADSFLFDTLTSVKIETEDGDMRIAVRQEFYKTAQIFNNIEFLTKIDFNNVIYKDLQYDKISNAVDTLFASEMLKTVLPEVLNWLIIDMNRAPGESVLEYSMVPAAFNFINNIVAEYNTSGGVYKGITNDLKAVISVAISAGESGLVDEALAPQIDFEAIKTILLANDRKVVNDIFGKLFDATALRFIAVEYINQLLADVSTVDVTFSPIAFRKVVWDDVNKDVTSMVNDMLDIIVSASEEFSGSLIQVIEENPYELLHTNTNVLTQKLGNLMTTMQNTNLLVDLDGNKVVHNQFMDYLNHTAINKYVDFNHFKGQNAWSNEMVHLNTLLSAVKDSGIVSDIIDNIDTISNIDINVVLNKLSQFNTNSQTYTHNIISALLESKAFSKLINVGYDALNTLIEQNQDTISVGANIGKIQYDKLNSEQEKMYTIAFFDNLVSYASTINLRSLETDLMSTIFSSKLTKLGLALDAVKNSAQFGPYVENSINHEGVYTSLMNALNSNPSFADFADFAVALDNNFSWNSEFSNIQELLDKMQTIQINGKSLLQTIIDGGDLTNIFESLTSSDIDNIIDPLVESDLLVKNVALFVNTLNTKISEMTGTVIGDASIQDIVAQKEDVKVVLKQMLALSSVLNSTMDETTLKANAQAIGTLLNTLKANSLENTNAVFGEVYNALVEYLKADLTFGDEITALVDEYQNPDDIDWKQLLDLFIEFENQDITTGFTPEFKTMFANIFATMKQDQDYVGVTNNVLDLMIELTDIDGITDFKQMLSLYSASLANLAQDQNTFANSDVLLEQEYYNKVKTVLELFKTLTGETIVDKLMQITVYQTEIDSANLLATTVESVDMLDATTDINEIRQLANDMITGLGDSQLLLDLLLENGNSYVIEEVIVRDEFKAAIENSGYSPEKQADLKTFFNIVV